MTKKHLIALADVVRDLRPPPIIGPRGFRGADQRLGAHRQWKGTIETLADFCASQNNHFDRQRWLDYIDGKCGPNGGEV